MSDVNELKRVAGEHAASFVRSGMVVGLGTGSTAIYAIRKIGDLLQSGQLQKIVAIPTSEATRTLAQQLNIPLTTFRDQPTIDLTIDGADEADPDGNLIKGGGGALLREKLVAQASKRNVIVVDASKRVEKLGTNWAVPVEVAPFAFETQIAYLESLDATVELRRELDADTKLFVTDNHNLILDCNFGQIDDAETLAHQLKRRTGIVEHGLFIGLATDLIIAGPTGIQHVTF
jgi:ribose 5-phosphate isomerase A